MTKKDLKTGMRVRTRNGGIYVVLRDCETAHYGHQDIVLVELGRRGFLNGSDYTEDLMIVKNDTEYDIVEVFGDGTVNAATLYLDAELPSVWKRSASILKNKVVIITNGAPGSGKDEVAKMLNRIVRVKKYSSIDKVKELATHCGWEGGKTEKDRAFLSDFKFLLSNYNDLPMEDIRKVYEKFILSDNLDALVLDIREPENIARAVQMFGAITVLIVRDNAEKITSNRSDANVEDYAYDYVLHNNGTLEDLKEEVKNFVHWLGIPNIPRRTLK